MEQCVIKKDKIFSYLFLFFRNTTNGDFMYYYLNLFFINSFFGFLLETGLKLLVFPGMNNGVLFGPWIPVYGFGTIIVAYFGNLISQKIKCSKFWRAILLFFSFVVLLSLLEWLGGVLIESVFHKEFWSYRNQKYNFGPYISLGMSLLWGGISMLLFYVVLPLEQKSIKKMPRWFSILALIIILIDCVLTYFVNL